MIWSFASLEKYGRTWHRMSLLRTGVIKQHKTQPNQTNKPQSIENTANNQIPSEMFLLKKYEE